MSIDLGTIEFLERLNGDTSLHAALERTLTAAKDKTGAVVAFAASHGFAIDRDGFDEARAALAGALESTGTLDDSQLEAVAGGFNPQPDPPGRIATSRSRSASTRK
jgi:predicted ribosomally synthesized peptide with nif11-like leader